MRARRGWFVGSCVPERPDAALLRDSGGDAWETPSLRLTGFRSRR